MSPHPAPVINLNMYVYLKNKATMKGIAMTINLRHPLCASVIFLFPYLLAATISKTVDIFAFFLKNFLKLNQKMGSFCLTDFTLRNHS